jgi:hypothetical protein
MKGNEIMFVQSHSNNNTTGDIPINDARNTDTKQLVRRFNVLKSSWFLGEEVLEIERELLKRKVFRRY